MSLDSAEIFERVLVRQIGDQVVPGAIPLDVDGVLFRVPLGADGIVHLSLEELTKFIGEQKEKDPPVVQGPPKRNGRRGS